MGWLDDQVALVTGGGSGLGRAVVERFVLEGARVVVLDRSAEKIDELKSGYDRKTVVTVKGDVTSPSANQKAVAAAVKAFGKLDTFVGNAGIWDYFIPVAHLPIDMIGEAFDEVFGINVKGYLLGTKAALPELLKTRGSVIYTLSNAAFDPAGGGVLYTASKHAIRGLITQLAYEFAPKVRVNGVAPGGAGTDLRGPKSLGFDRVSMSGIPGIDQLVEAATPLQFMPAVEDYAGMYVLLASRENSKTVTGSIIRGDGGIGVRGLTQTAGGNDL
ncbi:MAG TPA: 3-(cis-5,6-dihydroxycyclohexa-1,3-dien-1-yl)propanoate dehydrogenase [Acidimicrobiia bacterium]|nr:3-(cis-5,6-dihydroxycyclohexa-1,3-dien-1-yl)propanoate dehydrogenase [Acidimicrobiia bacterium]